MIQSEKENIFLPRKSRKNTEEIKKARNLSRLFSVNFSAFRGKNNQQLFPSELLFIDVLFIIETFYYKVIERTFDMSFGNEVEIPQRGKIG